MPILAFRGDKMIVGKVIKSKKATTIVFVFFFSLFGIQSSYADPGRTLEINVNALTYANANPTNLTPLTNFSGADSVYKIYGVRASDKLIFNVSNVSNQVHRGFFEIVGYFQNGDGFSITLSKNAEVVSPVTRTYAGARGYYLDKSANLDSYRLAVTLGQNPDFLVNGIPTSGLVGFPSDSNGLYYVWELYSSGQWIGSSAPAPALRQTSNLSFDQSQYGSDTLSDPDGQLRKTIDSINAKYGNLLR